MIDYEMPYYDHNRKELLNKSIWDKALKFVKYNCVEYDSFDGIFRVKPLKGYNTRTYDVVPDGKHFTCNCQGYVSKRDKGVENPTCSHCEAVIIWLRKMRIEKKLQKEAEVLSKTTVLPSFIQTPGVSMP